MKTEGRRLCSSSNIISFGLLLLGLTYLNPSEGLSLMSPKLKPNFKDLANKKNLMTGIEDVLGFDGKQFDPLSPQGSWFLFNQNDAKEKKKNRRRKCRKCSNQIPLPKVGPAGPPGPRGFQGPPGTSGGTLSLTEIENYIKLYLDEILRSNNTNVDILSRKRAPAFKANVPVIFTAALPRKEHVPSQRATLIKGLTVTFGPGQFKRGVIVNEGKFTMTRTGIYQVSATVTLNARGAPKTDIGDPRHLKDPVLFICVDNCTKDRRLRWSGSVDDRSTTAVLSGHLKLRRGQSIMVLISNPSRYDLEVGSGSTFSAALIGT